MMIKNIFIISCLIGMAHASFAAPITLNEIAAKALAYSPKVKAALEEAKAEGFAYDNKVAAFLPSLSLEAAHGIEKNLPEGPNNANPWRSELALTLTEKLYDNGVSWTNYQSGKVKTKVAQLRLEKVREEAILEILQAYFEYSRAIFLVQANEDLEKILAIQFKQAQSQYEQGIKPRKDFLRFRGQLQRSQISNLDLKNRAKLALEKISLLTGEPSLEISLWDPQKKRLPAHPEKNLQVSQTKDAQLFDLQKLINQYDIDLIERKNMPEFNLTADASYHASNYMGTGYPIHERDGLRWGSMLSLTYNIWDFGTRRREVAIAKSKKNSAEYIQENQLIDLTQQLSTLQNELQLGVTNVKLAKELLTLEQESYNIIESEYRQGRDSYVGLVNGLENLNNARKDYFNYVFTYLSNLAKFRFYEGSIDELDFE